MSVSRIRRSARGSVAAVLALLALGAVAASTVSIRAPRPRAILYGTSTVSAEISSVAQFSYAIVYVDGEAKGISNTLPVSFALDTREFANGTHGVQVVAYDTGGVAAESGTVAVTVLNPAAGMAYLPEPAQTVTAASPASPARTETPVSTVTRGPSMQPTPAMSPEAVAAAGTSAVGVPVSLEGRPLTFPLPPYIDGGRTMVMLRSLVAAAEGTVEWHGRKVKALVDGRALTFTFGERSVVVGNGSYQMLRPVVVRSDRTFVPVTVWRGLLGGEVSYDAANRQVLLGGRGARLAIALAR